MGIQVQSWKDTTIAYCDGCGRHRQFKGTDFDAVLAMLTAPLAAAERWHLIPYDYGYGIGFEIFCSEECLDPPEWD